MTEDRYGEFNDRVSVELDASDMADFSDGVCPSSFDGVSGGYPEDAFCFSNRRISLVAWMPSMTGI